MAIDLTNALKISASGMKAQGTRLRVISENIANQDSVGRTQGADPYRRKTIVFKDVMDRQLGIDLVQVAKIGRDDGDFKISYEPYHPLADEKGYIKRPNVNGLIEMMDMREAQRTYEANLTVLESSKTMIQRTIDLLMS
jgi:flagellar basal-body rod protein FlgC